MASDHEVDPQCDTQEWHERIVRRTVHFALSAVVGKHLRPNIPRVPFDKRRMVFSINIKLNGASYYAPCTIDEDLYSLRLLTMTPYLWRALHGLIIAVEQDPSWDSTTIRNQRDSFELTLCLALPNQAAFLTKRFELNRLDIDTGGVGVEYGGVGDQRDQYQLAFLVDMEIKDRRPGGCCVTSLTINVPFDMDGDTADPVTFDTIRIPEFKPYISIFDMRGANMVMDDVAATWYDEHLRQLAEHSMTDPGVY